VRKKWDGQKTNLSGEFFVAAESFKRGHQVSITLGAAKSVDLFVYNEDLNHTYNVQVRALREKSNNFPIGIEQVKPELIYVFVVLNAIGTPVEYFHLTGNELIDNEKEIWGEGGGSGKRPGIYPSRLKDYKDRWDVFERK